MYKLAPRSRIVLASGSPRRKELLLATGIPFETVSPQCDEKQLDGEAAVAMVERLALLKARSASASHPSSWIIGADTVVVIDGEILGKPESRAAAARMLRQIQGRWHEVRGGIALVNMERKIESVASFVTAVQMRALTPEKIERYIDSGEPMDKAGAYAIQGIGAELVSQVNGSYTNVVGLNVSALIDMLLGFGVVC